MQPRKWIITAMAATMLTAGGAGGALAAEGSAKVVVTNPALADVQAVKDAYTQLLAEGYDYIKVGRSMLGRAVIDAYDGIKKREVVINTKSGEIIHDMTTAAADYPAAARNAAGAAAGAVGEALGGAKEAASDGLTRAGDAASNSVGHARDAAGNALNTATDAASGAMHSATDAASRAGSTAGKMILDVTGGGIPGMGN